MRFLDAWQEEVQRTGSGGLRYALLQAGPILTGLLLEYHAGHIEAALTGGLPTLEEQRLQLPPLQELKRPPQVLQRRPLEEQMQPPEITATTTTRLCRRWRFWRN